MVHINYKWNISKIQGKNYMIEYISIILSERNNNSIELNELLLLLPKRTNHLNIKNNNKKKNILNFIRNNYGAINYFIKNETDFDLKNNMIFHKNKKDNLEFNDWVFVE